MLKKTSERPAASSSFDAIPRTQPMMSYSLPALCSHRGIILIQAAERQDEH